MAIAWIENYHDSRAWLSAKITGRLAVTMDSWGPNYGPGGRHERLKTWNCVLHAIGGGTIMGWSSNDEASGDVTDDGAKRFALERVERFLREELEAVSAHLEEL